VATKLNQIIAIEKGIKSRSLQELTEAHHALQKLALLAGISRTYRPRDEEGESLPPESTKVQIKAEEIIRDTVAVLTKLFDITATKDWANCNRAVVRSQGLALVQTMGLAEDRHLTAPREVKVMLSSRTSQEWDPEFIENVRRDGIVLYKRGELPAPFAA